MTLIRTAMKNLINKYPNERLIVFVDPDTGLQPVETKYGDKHVSKEEVKEIFGVLLILILLFKENNSFLIFSNSIDYASH